MSTIRLRRAEAVAIPFRITDPGGNLADRRVTWALAHDVGATVALRKASALLGQSTADVAIDSNTPNELAGSIHLAPDDFDALPERTYLASLWVDSGAGDDACVTPGGCDVAVIEPTIDREAPP